MQDDISSTVTHIQIQVQEGSSTASNGVMELLVRKHDQRSWRSSSTVQSAVRRSSLTSINSRAAPRKKDGLRSYKSVIYFIYFLFQSFTFPVFKYLFFKYLHFKYPHCTSIHRSSSSRFK